MDYAYQLKNIRKKYPDFTLNIGKLDIPKGQVVAIAGCSGSGKSTLLNILGTLDEPDPFKGSRMYVADNVIDFGKDVRKWGFSKNGMDFRMFRRDYLGFVFQDVYLPRSLRAYQAFMFNRKIGKLAHDNEKILEYLTLVGLKHKVRAKVTTLSGGERQRLVVAIALSKEPKIILADEPTSSLDTASQNITMKALKKWTRDTSGTLVWVCHDLALVDRYASHTFHFKDGSVDKIVSTETQE